MFDYIGQLTWDGAALIESMLVGDDVDFVAGNDIDFAAIISYELNKRDFSELTTLLFPCLM